MGKDRTKVNSYEEYLERYSSQKSRMKDFEFTKNALWRMDRVLSSLEFEIRDAETIYQFLIQKTRTVSFCEYLKRYIYVRAELEEPFETVPEAVYGEIIRNSFFEKHMVFSFQPSKKRTNALIHGWLTRETARRKTVFLLGFGLGMDDTDVTDFLTGVLGEEDFNFRDSAETVYWYCMHYHQPYVKAQELLWEARQACREPKLPEDYLESIAVAPKLCLLDETTLKEYLVYLKFHQNSGRETAFVKFEYLYGRLCAFGRNRQEGFSYEIERKFCCGIPRDSNGNLRSISESSLAELFHHHKMSRQRMNMLLRKERFVNRFDLITLMFFLYSEKEGLPDQRRDAFIRETNQMLTDCRMKELYFTNPYEAFIVLCLMTDDPLTTYGDVWEMSYKNEKKRKCLMDEKNGTKQN